MNSFRIAERVYKEYSNKEGNQHIASEYNLYHILKYGKLKKVSKILELGTGIGTILSLVQEAKKCGYLDLQKYIGTESNDFCISQIETNCIKNNESGLDQQIVDEGSKIDESDFQLAIVDGKAPQLERFVSENLSKNAMILIEGYREDQVTRIKTILNQLGRPYDYFMRFSTWNNPPYGPFRQKFQAGHTIFFLNPTPEDSSFCKKMRATTRLRYHGRKFLNFRNIAKILD